jgi:hypothetical protein
VWNGVESDGTDDDALHAGHFTLEVPSNRLPLAVAAPGVE